MAKPIFHAKCPNAYKENYFNCEGYLRLESSIMVTGSPMVHPESPRFCQYCGSPYIYIQRVCKCNKAQGDIYCEMCGDKIKEIQVERAKNY